MRINLQSESFRSLNAMERYIFILLLYGYSFQKDESKGIWTYTRVISYCKGGDSYGFFRSNNFIVCIHY